MRPAAYTSKQAIADGDVVEVLGKAYNLDKLENFMNNVKNHTEDKISITTYTVEDDAIITKLNYTGKTIECSIDTRRDKFAGNDDRKNIFWVSNTLNESGEPFVWLPFNV